MPPPNRLFGADVTYVKLATGAFCYLTFVIVAFVIVAFVIDAYAGTIVG